MANMLSAAEIAEIRDIFSQFDSDNSGTIDPSELRSLLAALEQDTSDAEVTRALGEFDKNGNGVIEFQEFIDWFATR